jgi:hypothetical protein
VPRATRKIELLDERLGQDWHSLSAHCDEEGNLRIDGQDLGPGTAPVSSDGEYEYSYCVKAADLPKLVALLGGAPGENILDLLARRYCGAAAHEFERTLLESGLELGTWSWGV